ncbi:universal stress protein [Yinghuangia soli]|uniref:Universal stress protein n=1 Tax=Yinghuangia soli TaxID=2908204 RepID=A0AA41U5A1_9ACTN|nr:universal stress protein [Yinghuangia soli]MCF2533821.1 universal stress protein [Yinghuangia soli]
MDRRIRHLSKHVVVGVDGSESSTRAVRHAAHEAARRAVPLQVLHAADPARHEYRSGPAAYAPAHAIVDTAAQEALDAVPGLELERTVVRATPAGALLDAAADAALVVIGSRGLGPVSGLVFGSVGCSLVARSCCPVLVVPDGAPVPGSRPRPGPVVVGVAGSACVPAVETALQEAALRGTRLRALHAWHMPLTSHSGAFSAAGAAAIAGARAQARARLAAIVADARHVEPGVGVDEVVVRDSAVRVLVGASEKAELLVLAARQRPPGPGMHIGAVTRAALHRTACPVLVVPVAPNGTRTRAERP